MHCGQKDPVTSGTRSSHCRGTAIEGLQRNVQRSQVVSPVGIVLLPIYLISYGMVQYIGIQHPKEKKLKFLPLHIAEIMHVKWIRLLTHLPFTGVYYVPSLLIHPTLIHI